MTTKVYRDFSQEELDREYNLAAQVENFKQYLVDYRTASKATRELIGGSFDIPYGSLACETLDIFYPKRLGNAPIHVFIHGGGYRAEDKQNYSFVAQPLVEAGAIVVIPNYGLCPAYRIDDIIHQTSNSIAWIYANARTMGGNPNAITISGHSAGAHTVSRLLETDWSNYGRTPDDVIKAGVAISGMYDQEPRRLCYVNEFIRLDEAESLRNSSLYRNPRHRVPYLIVVGEKECAEYHRQSAEFVAALHSRSYDEAEHLIVAGRHHYDILYSFMDFECPAGSKLYSHIFNHK